jgi:hypothetical protein
MLGKVFDQDLYNMPRCRQGLESTRKPGVTLANYQESKVRWLHAKLDEWMEKRLTCSEHVIRSPVRSTSATGTGNILVTDTDGRWGRFRRNGSSGSKGSSARPIRTCAAGSRGPIIGNHRVGQAAGQEDTHRAEH